MAGVARSGRNSSSGFRYHRRIYRAIRLDPLSHMRRVLSLLILLGVFATGLQACGMVRVASAATSPGADLADEGVVCDSASVLPVDWRPADAPAGASPDLSPAASGTAASVVPPAGAIELTEPAATTHLRPLFMIETVVLII